VDESAWDDAGMRDRLLALDQNSDRATMVLARIIGMEGFGGRRAGEAMWCSATGSEGQLAMGAANTATSEAARTLLSNPGSVAAVMTVPVGETEAVAAGLACGGSAQVLLLRGSALPEELFTALRSGVDLVLATRIDDGHTRVISAQTTAAQTTAAQTTAAQTTAAQTTVPGSVLAAGLRLLAKGPATAIIVEEAGETWFLEPLIAQPRLIVLGRAVLADAMTQVGALLGWQVEVHVDDPAGTSQAVAAATQARAADGVVVLSHDLAGSTAVLAAALRNGCGYVGALGSRHTQAARAELLRGTHGCSTDDLARVKGPVGLDLGARTPEETALAIAAEMLAVTRSRSASSLQGTVASING
jgi:xanthine dehydrogenase accessory factor